MSELKLLLFLIQGSWEMKQWEEVLKKREKRGEFMSPKIVLKHVVTRLVILREGISSLSTCLYLNVYSFSALNLGFALFLGKVLYEK